MYLYDEEFDTKYVVVTNYEYNTLHWILIFMLYPLFQTKNSSTAIVELELTYIHLVEVNLYVNLTDLIKF